MHGAIFGTNNPVAAALRNSILAEAMGEEVFVNAMEILYSSDDDDDDDDNSSSFDDDMEVEQEQQEIRRLRRSRCANNGRRSKTECNWWKLYLSPEKKQIFEDDENGRESLNFRRMFRVPYDVYRNRLLALAVTRWWPE